MPISELGETRQHADFESDFAEVSSRRALARLAERLFAGWPLILALVILGVAGTGAWLRWLAVPEYTARMVVAPYIDATSPTARSPTIGSIGALIGLPTQNLGNFAIYLDKRNSIDVAAKLLASPKVRQNIFGNQWDVRTQQWQAPHGVHAALSATLRSIFDLPTWSPPTASDLANYLEQHIAVATDRTSQHTTFSYSSRDPAFAAWLLQTIHDTTEEVMRGEARVITTDKIQHLFQQISASTLDENRQVLTELLAEQQRQLMLIGPKLPYAAIVVDPPNVEHFPGWPRPVLLLFLAVVAGALLGTVIVAARSGGAND